YSAVLSVDIRCCPTRRSSDLNFGVKLYGLFAEWKRTWLPAFIASLLISIVTLGIGIVLTYETIIVMSMVTILFSLPLRFICQNEDRKSTRLNSSNVSISYSVL